MLKVGLIDCINSLPLVAKILEDQPKEFKIVLDTPSNLSSSLKNKELDLSFISSSEYIRNKHQFNLIKKFGIAANGPVKSVYLYTKLPVSYIDTIYVTNHSKASLNLCRVLCSLHWDISPKFENLSSFEDLTSKSAFLLIGDMALMQPYFEGYHTIDLAEHWNEMTRAPFVFGVIAYQKGCKQEEVDHFCKILDDSFAWGQNNRAQIIDIARRSVPIQEHLINDYYNHVYHELAQKELDSIALFEELLTKVKQPLGI